MEPTPFLWSPNPGIWLSVLSWVSFFDSGMAIVLVGFPVLGWRFYHGRHHTLGAAAVVVGLDGSLVVSGGSKKEEWEMKPRWLLWLTS